MGQTKAGALKVTLKRWGITENEYREKLSSGHLRCSKCRQWKPADDFYKNATLSTGHNNWCKSCVISSSFKHNLNGSYRPGTSERRLMRDHGMYWCCDCHDWVSKDCVNLTRYSGRCIDHGRAHQRGYYRHNPNIRVSIRRGNRKREAMLKPIPADEKRRLLDLFNGMCAYCGTRPFQAWDHVFPIVRGGKSEVGNIVPSCRWCNGSKNGKNVFEWLSSKGMNPSSTLLSVIGQCVSDIDYTPWKCKGRPGEKNPCAKLTNAQAAEIRQTYQPGRGHGYAELAVRYGVHQETIKRIVKGETYGNSH